MIYETENNKINDGKIMAILGLPTIDQQWLPTIMVTSSSDFPKTGHSLGSPPARNSLRRLIDVWPKELVNLCAEP